MNAKQNRIGMALREAEQRLTAAKNRLATLDSLVFAGVLQSSRTRYQVCGDSRITRARIALLRERQITEQG